MRTSSLEAPSPRHDLGKAKHTPLGFHMGKRVSACSHFIRSLVPPGDQGELLTKDILHSEMLVHVLSVPCSASL